MTQPIIRRAGAADTETLAAIGAATFVETFGHLYPPQDLAAFLADAHSPARARTDLADPRKAVWLAEASGAAVGYALAGPCDLPHPEVTERCGELKRLYLLKGWQNDGLGGRLFSLAMAWLREAGAESQWIGVWSQNHGAKRFYARQGFEQVGEYDFPVGESRDHEFILRRRTRDT